MRFIGNIEAKTDAKGRAFLPAVFRKVLQASGEEGLVLRKDVFQNCLVLYPESVWNERLDLLKSQLRPWKQTHQQIFRQFVSEAEVVSLDGNGRFLISKRDESGRDRSGYPVYRNGQYHRNLGTRETQRNIEERRRIRNRI